MPGKYVLMLENDQDDRYITQTTLRELGLNIPVRYEYYSPSLLDLIGENDRPSLVLLAYNTTPENGLVIVKEFKTHPGYAHIPVIVLTEELQNEWVRQYYRAGANSVVKKPNSVVLTREKVKAFFDYWFNVAEV